MKNVILGTAGHVDHGKTELIKALSGIDTDRLSEEKKRGITIELGFAHIPNEEGYNIGVIDVPGHEKFIKNMLAGIGGIDFVIFVVAADEGIMPQTREHFEILETLGINDGIVVITKSDLVDEEWLTMLKEELIEYLKGSFLEGRDIIPVSAKNGHNIQFLKDKIIEKSKEKEKSKEDKSMFRLPIDRVFIKQGFGTVVTGTLLSGECNINDEVFIFPNGIKTKLRGLQAYGKEEKTAYQGQRTAINLATVSKEEIKRGDVLAKEGAVVVTSMIDVSLTIFKSTDKIILNNSRVHLYIGSAEVIAKIILLEKDAIGSGESSYAQLRLEEPVAIRRGDRFIIRFYSPTITVGGGKIIDALPEKHKRSNQRALDIIKNMDRSDINGVISAKVSEMKFYELNELAKIIGMEKGAFDRILNEEIKSGNIIKLEGDILLSKRKYEIIEEKIVNILSEYHEKNPLHGGISKGELINIIQKIIYSNDNRLANSIISYLIKNNVLADKGKDIALSDFKISYTDEQKKLKEKIISLYKEAGMEMLKNDEVYLLYEDKNITAMIIKDLIEEKTIKKVNDTYNMDYGAWDKIYNILKAEPASKEFTLAEFRDLIGTSRKYAQFILEAFDKEGITAFDGKVRKVR